MGERTRIAILLVLAALIYGNTLTNGFALDDGIYVVRNSAVTHFSVPAIFQPNKDSNVFRPVTFATFALNWAVGRGHAWGYHALNLLLHALVTLLFYLVLRKLLEVYENADIVAWVAALLFAVPPIQ